MDRDAVYRAHRRLDGCGPMYVYGPAGVLSRGVIQKPLYNCNGAHHAALSQLNI